MKIKIIIVVVLLAGAVFGGYLILKDASDISETGGRVVSAETEGSFEGESGEVVYAFEDDDLSETYINSDYGFGLKYPAAFAQIEIPADEAAGMFGDLVIFDDTSGDFGFQIMISPFDEPDANITPERIRADIPDLIINNPEVVNLGEGRGKGTTFLDGKAGKLETNRHIWFAANGSLYQITSEQVLDVMMRNILATWTFRD